PIRALDLNMIVRDQNYHDKGGPRKSHSAREWARAHQEKDRARRERKRIFQDLDAVPFATRITLSTGQRRRADSLFAALACPGYKRDEKRQEFALLFQSLLQAHCLGGAVMFPRNKNNPEYSGIRLQMIDLAVDHGYAREVRSSPGWSDH